MDFGIVALIQAVVWTIVGVGFLAVPRQWVAPFGSRMDDTGAFVGRALGAAYLGLAVLLWLGRGTDDVPAQQAIAYANLVTNGLLAIVHALAIPRGDVINARGWVLVALTGLLAIGWALVALT